MAGKLQPATFRARCGQAVETQNGRVHLSKVQPLHRLCVATGRAVPECVKKKGKEKEKCPPFSCLPFHPVHYMVGKARVGGEKREARAAPALGGRMAEAFRATVYTRRAWAERGRGMGEWVAAGRGRGRGRRRRRRRGGVRVRRVGRRRVGRRRVGEKREVVASVAGRGGVGGVTMSVTEFDAYTAYVILASFRG